MRACGRGFGSRRKNAGHTLITNFWGQSELYNKYVSRNKRNRQHKERVDRRMKGLEKGEKKKGRSQKTSTEQQKREKDEVSSEVFVDVNIMNHAGIIPSSFHQGQYGQGVYNQRLRFKSHAFGS